MATLDYARPRTHRPAQQWGPILFRPSRRTAVWLAVALAAWAWTAYRPQAWRLNGVAVVSAQGGYPDSSRLQFLPSGNLLRLSEMAELFDPTTGRVLATYA